MPSEGRDGRLYYLRLPEFWRKQEKLDFLSANTLDTVNWQRLSPNQKNTWLRSDTEEEFDAYLPIGSKEAKRAKPDNAETIFKTYSRGVATSRDMYVYDYEFDTLSKRMRRFVEEYNSQVDSYKRQNPKPNIDDFVDYDRIAWSRDLKLDLKRGNFARYEPKKIRKSLYRPFHRKVLFFDRVLNEEVYQQPSFLPDERSEAENRIICVSGIGSNKPFQPYVVNEIPCLDMLEKRNASPSTHMTKTAATAARTSPIGRLSNSATTTTTQALANGISSIMSYALLHHPGYRERYALDLKRNLPRIPFVPDSSTPSPGPLPRCFRKGESIRADEVPP